MIEFVRGANPIWYFVNLQGIQFDDTYYMYVLENEIPYVPATVYHTPSGIPWEFPIQCLANGTFPEDIYADPTKYYRLEFRQAVGPNPPSQSDPLIYLIPNYRFSETGGFDPVTLNGIFTDNQIANAQFSIVNFDVNESYVLTAVTNPPPLEIAPGWELILQGTGNVSISRVAFNDTVPTPTNAPYALRLNLSGGWSGLPILRQRFNQNGMLWATHYVSSSFTARLEGSPQTVIARLDASNGQALAVLSSNLVDNTFREYTGFAQLDASTNPDIPPDAAIDFKLLLPTNVDIYLTSLQAVASTIPINFPYEEDTIDRQIDHLFHYYKPKLEWKPISDYLVGWDFPLNPSQFYTNGVRTEQAIGANKSEYKWDQTIVFQSEESGVATARAANGGLQLTAKTTAGQVAVIQYLDAVEARQILAGRTSVGIKASCSGASQIATVSLWATNDTNLPNVAAGTNNSIVATLGPTGNVATQNGSWTPLQRNNPTNAQFTLTDTPTEFYFTGWVDNAATPRVGDVTFFAIVIATNEIAVDESVTFDWISLCPGDIATRPAPQTVDQVEDECERFFWKTFDKNTTPAQMVGLDTGYLSYQVINASGDSIFQVRFSQTMRRPPNVVTYNPIQANISIWNFVTTSIAASTTVANTTTKATTVVAGTTGGWASGNILGVHITADARLGIVN